MLKRIHTVENFENGKVKYKCREGLSDSNFVVWDEESKTWDSSACTNTNECELSLDNCHKNANCVDKHPLNDPADPKTGKPQSFSCECKEGLIGDGNRCEDINECEANSGFGDCNQVTQICINYIRSLVEETYECKCKSGLKKDELGNCQDINECLTDDNGGCWVDPQDSDIKATCDNLSAYDDSKSPVYDAARTRTCECPTGFRGDGEALGTGCTEVPLPGGMSASPVSSGCGPGWVGQISWDSANTPQKWDTSNCEDEDRCTSSINPLICQSTENCINKNGEPDSCECKEGYQRNNAGVCVNINECSER